jgi:hypothetical protein
MTFAGVTPPGTGSLGLGQAFSRFRLLLDAYGLPLAQRREVAEAILDKHDWCYAIITDAADAGHPGFADYWGRDAGIMTRARRWCEAHHHDLLASGARTCPRPGPAYAVLSGGQAAADVNWV